MPKHSRRKATKHFPRAKSNAHIIQLVNSGIKPSVLAEMMGVASTTIGAWINNTRPAPKWTELAVEAIERQRNGSQSKSTIIVARIPNKHLAVAQLFIESIAGATSIVETEV